MNAPVSPQDLKAGTSRRELMIGATVVGGALLVGCSPGDLLSVSYTHLTLPTTPYV